MESLLSPRQRGTAVAGILVQPRKIGETAQLHRAYREDLLEGVDVSLDLVVFNPPWTRGTPRRALDLAMVFEDGLFERFFDQAFDKLAPGGRVVLVFSNILQLVQPDAPNPIDRELQRGRFVVEERLQRRVKPNRRTHKRTREKVQVWVLSRSE